MKTPRKTQTAMKSWHVDEIQPRRDATEAFCSFLGHPNSVTLRNRLIKDSEGGPCQEAKELFATLGNFYLEGQVPQGQEHLKPIPKTTGFRVFGDTPFPDRDTIVDIVFPKYPMDETMAFEASRYYRCTYWPYKSKTLKERRRKAKVAPKKSTNKKRPG